MAAAELRAEMEQDGNPLYFEILLVRQNVVKPSATREISNFAKVSLTVRIAFYSKCFT